MMVLNNRTKRIITSTIGILIIYLGFKYLPSLRINNFNFHPLILFSFFVFFMEIFLQLKTNKFSRNYKYFLFSIIYTIFFIHVLLIENLIENWEIVFLFNLSVVFIVDSFGYIFGQFFGNNKIKILENISPNKTVEGYIGSVIFGFTFGFFILLFIYDKFFLETNYIFIILFILGLITTSIFGDLFVSKIKRMIKVDDFSNFFYGHGGILDRLDSILPSFVLSFWIFFLI
ncbi:MAG: phosphatidate cytidylyltransferase [Dehalococcoidia bacterium]|nr:phosphatidate cytidylyltransferase [Dehalococcoidia bacterium]